MKKQLSDLKRYLWISQLGFFTLLIVCSLIIPSVASSGGGVSNFGNHHSTVVLYTLAFLICSVFLILSARVIFKTSKNYLIAYGLILLALLELLVLASTFPRHIKWVYSVIHDDIGIALFAYEFILSILFLFKLKTTKVVLVFLVEFIGQMIALLTIYKLFHLLFIGQMIGAVGFGVLLAISVPKMIESNRQYNRQQIQA
jgi:hypothetical protein